MDEFTNPYRPGAGTSPPALLGRDDLLSHFDTTVRRAISGRPGKSLMPIGLRGVGKTVLLTRFSEIAEQAGFAVGAIEAPESGDFASLLATRLRRILLAYDNERKTAKSLKALRVLKAFTLQLPDGSQVSIDVDALAGSADSGNLSDDVTDLLVAAGEAAAERDSGVLLAVDEVQYLSLDPPISDLSSYSRIRGKCLPAWENSDVRRRCCPQPRRHFLCLEYRAESTASR
jgi:hypothetical protein